MALPLLYGAPNNVSIRFVTYCINEIVLLFCDLSILMHIAVVLWVFNHCMKIPQFISPTVLRHLGCFCGFAVTNSTPVSIFAKPLAAGACPRVSLVQRGGAGSLGHGAQLPFR